MKIKPYYTQQKLTSSKLFSPRFTSKRIDCYDTTEFFRNDLDWKGFSYLLSNFYKDTPKVNVVSYACSTGKETYSLALQLKNIFGNTSNKFFPIIAKDIDPNAITKAKRGRYIITQSESIKLDKAGDLNLYRYIDVIDDGLEKFAYVKDSLKSLVNFSKADICQDIDSIPNKNTVLICRNFFGYLTPKEQSDLVNKLEKQLDKTSLVALGSYDKAYGITKLFEQKGFKETEIEHVFKKLF